MEAALWVIAFILGLPFLFSLLYLLVLAVAIAVESYSRR